MKSRTPNSLLLAAIVLLTSGNSALPHSSKADDLTPQEIVEAHSIALKFSERLQETEGDIAPLIPEFFVSDFDERLRDDSCAFTDSHDNLFLYIADDAMRQLSDQDLRRLFVMVIDAFCLTLKVIERYDAEPKPQLDGQNEGDIANFYPLELIELVKADPTIVSLSEELKRRKTLALAATQNEAASGGQENDPIHGIVTTTAQLRGLMALGEKVIDAMKQYLATHHAPPESSDGKNFRASVYDTDLTVIEKETCRRPTGTRLIHVRTQTFLLLQFHLTLVSENGEFKILKAIPLVDGD